MLFPLPEMLFLGQSCGWLFVMTSDISFKCSLSKAVFPEPLFKAMFYLVILFYFDFIDYFPSLEKIPSQKLRLCLLDSLLEICLPH